ncbi:MAG: outer membrane lipoprotein-sorting protein [Bacteroidales bacterium]
MITMKIIQKNTIILFATMLMSLSLSAQNPKEIMREVEQNMRGDASYNEMSMTIERPRYTREVSMRSWALGEDYSLVYITAPARDEGTAFLKRGNQIWNYQPNIDRTVKMPPSMMSQSWMGSDFTNDDVVNASSLTDDYTHELLGEEEVDGHLCYVIELTPKPDNPVVYEKSIHYIAKEYMLPARTENYDERDNLVNTIYFREFTSLGGRTLPAVMEVVPAEEENQRTVITTHNADFNIDISEDFFSTQNLTQINP